MKVGFSSINVILFYFFVFVTLLVYLPLADICFGLGALFDVILAYIYITGGVEQDFNMDLVNVGIFGTFRIWKVCIDTVHFVSVYIVVIFFVCANPSFFYFPFLFLHFRLCYYVTAAVLWMPTAIIYSITTIIEFQHQRKLDRERSFVSSSNNNNEQHQQAKNKDMDMTQKVEYDDDKTEKVISTPLGDVKEQAMG